MMRRPYHTAQTSGTKPHRYEILRRGRQKGRRVSGNTVRAALERGGNALFPLLNFDRPLKDDKALTSPLARLDEFAEWLWTDTHPEPRFLAFSASMMLQDLASVIVTLKGERSPQAMLLWLRVLIVSPSPAFRLGNPPVPPPDIDAGRLGARIKSLRRVAELLLGLYAESDDWLQRLRVCRYKRCGRFFLDPTRNGSKRFCKPGCKVEDHRSSKKPAP